MIRAIAAAALIAFLVFSAALTSDHARLAAQEPDATPFAASTPLPSVDSAPAFLEPDTPIMDAPFVPEADAESSAEAFDVVPEEEIPALVYGDYIRTPRPAPAPVDSFEELRGRIDALLTELPGQAGVALLRPGHVLFARDEARPFRLASVAKLFILAAYFDRTAAEERELQQWEYELLDSMIAYSDNDAAEYLWQELGGTDAVVSFLNARGFYDFTPADDGSWGGAGDTPTEVAAFMSRLVDGSLLGPENTQVALSLLGHVSEWQRWGVTGGVSAHDPGASVLLKDGWYPDWDGWLVNSAGFVVPSTGAPAYALVILGEGFALYDDGLDVVNEIAQMVNGLMLSPPAYPDDIAWTERDFAVLSTWFMN